MSVIVTTREQIAHSPINRSTAKQLFSFSKSARFKPPKKPHECERFYDLPTTKLRRTTSFGFGTRVNLAKRDSSPPPNTYTLPSDFEVQHKGKVFSFGICRDSYAKVFIRPQPGQDRDIPGPGTYEVREVPGKEAKKFSLRPRTTTPSKEVLGKPGPGHYPVYPGITKSGSYFLSKFKSSLCRTFGGRLPDHTLTSTYSIQTPGPGTYPAPSDFGIYRAQDKYIKEYERTEDRRKSAMTTRAHRRNVSQMSERTAPIRFSSPSGKSTAGHSGLRNNASEVTLSRETPIPPSNKTSK